MEGLLKDFGGRLRHFFFPPLFLNFVRDGFSFLKLVYHMCTWDSVRGTHSGDST